ncbi:MAG: hypothetical protein JOZ10_06510 [Acidobacteria bacterium]|nr:hypothetical protein [Acidobacteriota bacterium]MBV9147463.1 hypothetical protein [Acidobacteriota bacterium]MBV9435528.1 hypothetical protein [Acidobacteriota bacterium]
MSFVFLKRTALFAFLLLSVGAAFPQDQSDAAPSAPTTVILTQGPMIQYADDEFAVITWSTDQPFASRVFYGKDAGNLNQISEDGKALSLRHQVDLRNLQASTTYYFRIDTGAGNATTSADSVNGFQTTALGANPVRNQPPFKGSIQPVANQATGQTAATANFGHITVTRGPAIQYLDDSTAVIAWTTNVPASNTLYYGPDSSNLLYTGGDFKDATEHRIHLSNLRPNTRYYFEFDEPSSQQPVASFTTVSAGGQPLYDQPPAPFSGASNARGPQLSHREHAAGHTNELPSGTEIFLSLDNELSTRNSQPGDRFTATISQPVRDLNDQIVIPTGAKVNGQVTESEEGKNLPTVRGRGKLNMRFETVSLPNGANLPISATLISVNDSGGNGSVNSEGEVQSQTKTSTAAKGAAVGAGLGTIAGLILGGPFKGLAIGAIAGGGYILATKGKDVELPQNTGLKIRLDQPVSLGNYSR